MTSVKISKIPNGVGNYTTQFYDEQRHKWIIEAWKSFEDAEDYYFCNYIVTKFTDLKNSLILELQ